MGRSCPHARCAIFSLIAFFTPLVSAQAATAVAAQYTLTATTSLPFPTATQNSADTQSYIVQQWSLSKGRIQNGAKDLAFVSDPFPNSPVPGGSGSTTGPVLEVTYPAGSYSVSTGGAQLYSLWNTSTPLQSMLLSYEVAFDAGFDWVRGGKLPGLKGGPDPLGCSGGNKPNGSDCFSALMMWRTNGTGESAGSSSANFVFCQGLMFLSLSERLHPDTERPLQGKRYHLQLHLWDEHRPRLIQFCQREVGIPPPSLPLASPNYRPGGTASPYLCR
jgi:hypothetical protein